jgi:antitoxin (DNA-binding transcriptional repressor) of toxin-antitoxin stability system
VKFVSVRELRNRPGRLWKALESDDFVVTNNGKPVGLLIAVPDDEIENSLLALRRARATLAVSRMRETARRRRTNRLSPKQIEGVIARTRRLRSSQ